MGHSNGGTKRSDRFDSDFEETVVSKYRDPARRT
jgi:hypothetical protein